jgi:hypothetical protein
LTTLVRVGAGERPGGGARRDSSRRTFVLHGEEPFVLLMI